MAQVAHPSGALHTGSIADDLAHPPGLLRAVVVSPAGPVYSGEARWLAVGAWDGQLGIWPRHTVLVAALGVGLLRIGHPDGRVDRFAVSGGFVRVGDDKVTVLVDLAVAEANVDEAQSRRELAETLAALRHPASDAQYAELLERRAWCEARLRLARPA
jgi:F-type H+-transporting ATPase subunit epsilon